MKNSRIDKNSNLVYNVISYGLIGDGKTNNDSAFSKMISSLDPYSTLEFEPGKEYVITNPINISKPIFIHLNGATIIGKKSKSIFEISSSNVWICNGVLDLDLTSENGIRTNDQEEQYSEFYFEKLSIVNQSPTANNTDGGIYLKNSERVYVSQCYLNKIDNEKFGTFPHSPAIKFVDCMNIFVSQTVIEQCGVGINIYNTNNVHISDVETKNIRNNAFYLLDDSKNITLVNCSVNQCSQGVTIRLTNSNDLTLSKSMTSVRVIGIEVHNASDTAISLRDGSGIIVQGSSFIDCNCAIRQSTPSDVNQGVRDVIISECITFRVISDRAFYFISNKRLNCHNNTFKSFVKSNSFAIRMDNCSECLIYDNVIIGDQHLLNGISLKNNNNLKIINNFIKDAIGQTINFVEKGDACVVIQDGEIVGENLFVNGSSSPISPPQITIQSTNRSILNDDYIGKIAISGLDTSKNINPEKFVIAVKALTKYGNAHEVEFYVDDTLFMKAFSDGTVSAILPTTQTNVPIGGIWNNNGIPTIRKS